MKSTLVRILTLAAMAATLAGCYTPSGQPDNTGTGALLGAATGATIGSIADRRNPGAGALIGAAAGMIAGGLAGHAVNQQHEARRQAYSTPSAPAPAPATPQGPPLGIADVKSMSKAHVSDEIIINQINNTHTVYHLDADAIIDLSNSGVSQAVIAYMINTSNAVVTQAPPAPRVETVVVAPGPDYTWVDGEWMWNGGAWIWVSGRWVVGPYPHAVWISSRWEHGPYGWHRSPGRWR